MATDSSGPDARWAKLQGEQIAALLDEAREETRRETIEAVVAFVRGQPHNADAWADEIEREFATPKGGADG